MDLIIAALAATASILGSAMALPQARQIVRTRRVDGVSATWIGVSAALNAWWIAYALATGLWLLLPVSVVSLTLYLVIAVVFVATVGRRSLPGLVLGAGVLGMSPLPFLVTGGWMLAGLAIGFSYGLQLLPAVVGVFRTRRLAGVAVGTWAIGWTEAVLWSLVGVGVADAALIAGGATGVVMSSLILARLALTGHVDVSRTAVVRVVPARWRGRAAVSAASAGEGQHLVEAA